MKTVLIVLYHYTPEEGSCSEKNDRIVKLLIDNGYKVVILTKGYEGLPKVTVNENVTVIRTEKNGIFHKKQSVHCFKSNYLDTKNDFKIKTKNIISKLMIPDSIIDWVFEIKKFYKKNSSLFNNIDIILSVSSPYSAHLASEYLSEALRIPFVMCYGDPWIYEPKRKRGYLRLAYEKKMEGRLLSKASHILLITEWNKRKYCEIYGISATKISTYNIGFDETECLTIPNKIVSENLNIIYGGSLDSVHRDPKPFIEAMSKINGVKAYIYNSDNVNVSALIEKYDVSDKVILKPLISSKEFYKELYKMDALLLFGNKTPFQVPGKVFTYISTQKGIIYIKNNEYKDDGTEYILNKYGGSITVRNNVNEIVGCLEKMKKNKIQNVKNNAKEFEFHETMYSIVEALEKVNE